VHAELILNKEKAISIIKETYSYTIDDAESESPTWGNVEIEVSLIDLNDDKKNEIIAVLRHRLLCGTQGCMTVILEKTKNDWKPILNRMITHGDYEIFDETSNGYKIINFGNGPKLSYVNGSYAFQ
jgi:hypothetical protein